MKKLLFKIRQKLYNSAILVFDYLFSNEQLFQEKKTVRVELMNLGPGVFRVYVRGVHELRNTYKQMKVCAFVIQQN